MMSLDQLISYEIAKIEINISKPKPERGDKWNEDEFAVFKVTISNLTSYELRDVIVLLENHNCTHAGIHIGFIDLYPRRFAVNSMSRNTSKYFYTRYKADSNVETAKLWATVSAGLISEKTTYKMGEKEFTIYEE